MQSLLSRHDATKPPSHLALPFLYFLASILAALATPAKHSLLTSAIAWTSICTFCTLRTGAARSLVGDVTAAKKLAWSAGALWTLAQVCERVFEGRGIWWAKVDLILVVGDVRALTEWFVGIGSGSVDDTRDHCGGCSGYEWSECAGDAWGA